MISPQQIVVLLIVGVLLFGRRLPDVGRSIGAATAQLRRALRGIRDELRDAVGELPPRSGRKFPDDSDNHGDGWV